MSLRPIKRLIKSKPTLEGAGVHLRRAFGFGNTSDFDPFLLLDDYRNDVPDDYLAGFPWHPHRGIEIIHQEKPKGDATGRIHGFQLWANLPTSLKMTAPRYQELKALDIPVIT